MRSPTAVLTLLTLSLSAAACGKVQEFADASTQDTQMFDTGGTVIDANPRGTVTVTTYDPVSGGAVTTGTAVLFIDPDGTPVARVATDTSGKAQADVLPGASVTAVWTVGTGSYQVETIRDIKPGDDLVMALSRDTTNPGTFTVTFPALGRDQLLLRVRPVRQRNYTTTTSVTFQYLKRTACRARWT